jgi:hypothetical protein
MPRKDRRGSRLVVIPAAAGTHNGGLMSKLATKDAETLNEIHKYKLAFPGARVISKT